MNRLSLAAVLGLAVAGCAHSVTSPTQQPLQTEAARCELVHTLMREPIVSQRLMEMATEGRELPLPVAVFLRDPEQGLLERLFDNDAATCGDAQFRVVRELTREGLVLYLQETPEGYAYDARRAGPEALSMGGEPQGVVRRNGQGGWATATD
ncbi:hypothetical protein [Hyalangium rubrum]|uniref:Lipoprotein n=1 Tax=Hyalangium rubrum TaxID=3103134 RepID=A0ABU5HCZ9_9BACT|nr:hypothetical protein [Hyalangium sp. s54d21]MDY7229975.1 hypothetical protein [Hyalangium sp. s54d21]